MDEDAVRCFDGLEMIGFGSAFHRNCLDGVAVVVVDNEDIVVACGGWCNKFSCNVTLKFSGRLEDCCAYEV